MNRHPEGGFSLIELCVVVVIIGILAAIGIANYVTMQDRAKEGSTKSNMHTFQLCAEEWSVDNMGFYATEADSLVPLLPSVGATFINPFDALTTTAWEDRALMTDDPSGTPGMVSYADSAGVDYNIKGVGRETTGPNFPLPLELNCGL